MDQSMKAIIKKVKSMDVDFTYGRMDQCITVTGMKTELRVMVNTNGKMVEST